jgi:hypothetical protein
MDADGVEVAPGVEPIELGEEPPGKIAPPVPFVSNIPPRTMRACGSVRRIARAELRSSFA